MEEIWQNIEGFEYYQASNLGQIKSLGRVTNAKNGSTQIRKEKILKQGTNQGGYKMVSLWKDGKAKTFKVHRLVYEAFCGKIPEGMQVNHINENKSDNRLENLNLMTPKENCNWGTHIERCTKANLNHPQMSKPVVGCDSEGNVIVYFPSICEAHRNGYSQSAVCRCCKGIKPQYKGLLWKYLS